MIIERGRVVTVVTVEIMVVMVTVMKVKGGQRRVG